MSASFAHVKPGVLEGRERGENLLALLATSVRTHRQMLGLSQQALAKQAGLSGRFIAALESGKGNISLTNLAEVAHALHVPLRELLRGKAQADPGAHDRLTTQVTALLGQAKPAALEQVLTLLRQGEDKTTQRHPSQWPLVALVGLRGAGKSTLGPLLAQSLGRSFVELDDLVQEDTGLPVTDIFHLHGELYYRNAERRTLAALVDANQSKVVALSGGAPADADIRALLKIHCCMIWVQAQPEQHMQRVLQQGDHRPMANRPNAMRELRDLLEERTPYYKQAHLIADTSQATAEETVQYLLKGL